MAMFHPDRIASAALLALLALLLALLPLRGGRAQTTAAPQAAPHAISAKNAPKNVPVVHPAHHARPHKPATAHTAKPASKPATAAPAAAAAATTPAPAAVPAAPDKGSVTGLKLPRFAALRADEVNMRAGPGEQYPIDWVYKRRDLPVQILREFEVWRLVADPDGVKGWVHQATLTGRRSFVTQGTDHTLRASPAETAGAVAILQPGVIGRLRHCDPASNWCEVQVGGYRGWLQRIDFWGLFAGEAVP